MAVLLRNVQLLLVYCGPAGNFVSSSGAARLPLQYATGVRNLLVYLSLVSYYSIRVQQKYLNPISYCANVCKTPNS